MFGEKAIEAEEATRVKEVICEASSAPNLTLENLFQGVLSGPVMLFTVHTILPGKDFLLHYFSL